MISIPQKVAKPMAVLAAGMAMGMVVIPSASMVGHADGYGPDNNGETSSEKNAKTAAEIGGGVAVISAATGGLGAGAGASAGAAGAAGTVGTSFTAAQAAQMLTDLTTQLAGLQSQLAAQIPGSPAAQAIQVKIDAVNAQIKALANNTPPTT